MAFTGLGDYKASQKIFKVGLTKDKQKQIENL